MTVIKKTELKNTGNDVPVMGGVDYRGLADFRYAIRKFLAFSEAAAIEAGLTAQQHQALLTIKGIGSEQGLSVGDLATRLLVKHHSAAELAKRLEEAGLVLRSQDPHDGRRVLLTLTDESEKKLESLSGIHVSEIGSMAPELAAILGALSVRS
ncbi:MULTISPECIES: MarR family winged helix-turn-helix transcriptional regulator [Aminobacter]|uniref:MarR family winged helix-turn-helix transcriptional regulator n=1 Tax=Aminobacter TaxID=31988 RepID=UPI001FEED35B|nr:MULTISPECIES: MarR family transcriptional regulator [Aminobacter]MCX8571802.1 MarR family transcriptional regulator [Aminobacter sp. MET-1]MDR7225283.1 DNA-binding MarR family transcriptional regulator [Aminobacter aminovorans]